MSDLIDTLIFSTGFREILKYQTSWKYVELAPSFCMWTEGRTGGQTDRRTDGRDETNCRFSKFCQRTLKFSHCKTTPTHQNRIQIENTSNLGIAFYQPTLSKPTQIFNLMFFWPCIMNWLYINYQKSDSTICCMCTTVSSWRWALDARNM